MLSLLEVAERTQKGPIIEVKDWDLGLFHRVTELAQRHEIVYPDDGSFFNMDAALADRAFEAALNFLVEAGVYCLSTNRVIEFTREEVLEAVQEAPRQIVVGAGRDQRVLTQKAIEGRERLNQCAGMHAPWSEDLAPLVVYNFAAMPTGDYLEGFNFSTVDGREVFGMPTEAYAARRQLSWLREGIRRAGRPGMAVAYYPIGTRAGALLAPIDPECGLRPTDGVLLSVLPSAKVEHGMLTAAVVYEEYGCFKRNGGGWGMIGGFAGGPEGAIIEGLVMSIAGWIVYRDSFVVTGVWDLRADRNWAVLRQPKLNWAYSVVCQALNARSDMIYFGASATTR